MITVTINDREVRLERQVTVLEAAKKANIKIPTLCHYEQLEPYGGCRLCLVEVERMPQLQTACTLLVTDGMVVRTESETISNARRGMLEFLLINHLLDCPYCDKAGECDLQDLVEKYGAARGRYTEKKRKLPPSFEDPILARNMERCILCTRCVRMCDEVQGASAIAVVGRGGYSRVEPFSGGRYNCEYCGNCLTVCPVGAILNRLYLHSYRPWQIDREVETICPYCGVGCSVRIEVRDNNIKRVVPQIAIAALSYLLDAMLYLMSERPNEQGAMDMGCLPDTLPGYRPISTGDFRGRFESQWNAPIPEKDGLTLMEMFEAASSGSLKALYVMGENPAFNLPNSSFIEKALDSLDFLVVQDIFLTETAKMADIVFPALGWTEKDGTFTNLERRIQRLRKAVTGTGMEDWRIISEVSKKMGYWMDYSSSEEIMEEISRVSPLYRGIQPAEIAKGDLLWPYKGEPLRGTLKDLSILGETSSKVQEIPVSVEGREWQKEGGIYLIVDVPLFHSGTISRKSPALRKICSDAVLKANPMFVKRLNLSRGDIVKVTSDRSSIIVKIDIEPDIPENVVALSNNFEGAGAYRLFGYILDPITKAPGIKGCEVLIERVPHEGV